MKHNEEKLYKILSEVFEIDISEINHQTSQEETDSWDSLNTVRMIVAIENIFSIRLDIDDISIINKVSDIVELLRSNSIEI